MLKFLPMVWRNAWRGKVRTLCTAGGVAVSLLAFATLRAVDAGMRGLYARAAPTTLVVFQEGRY